MSLSILSVLVKENSFKMSLSILSVLVKDMDKNQRLCLHNRYEDALVLTQALNGYISQCNSQE